jgi:hypothetical protein
VQSGHQIIACFGCRFAVRVMMAGEENKKEGQSDTAEDVTPSEDLMREHGVLDRFSFSALWH